MCHTPRTEFVFQFLQLVLDGAMRKTGPGADFFRREAFTYELQYYYTCVIQIGRTERYG